MGMELALQISRGTSGRDSINCNNHTGAGHENVTEDGSCLRSDAICGMYSGDGFVAWIYPSTR